jgi:hypothetical protein
MRKLMSLFFIIFSFSLVYATDKDFGSILFYAGRENIKATKLSENIGTDVKFRFYYSDKEYFDVSYNSEFKILKKITPGTYHITKIQRILRVGKPIDFNEFDVTVSVEKDITSVFPLRVFYEITENNDLRTSWKPILKPLTDDEISLCNNHIIK